MPQGAPIAYYNTGETSGMNSGTTYSAALSSGAMAAAPGGPIAVGGNANIATGAIVGGALIILVAFHLLGFRFGFDVSVGRK